MCINTSAAAAAAAAATTTAPKATESSSKTSSAKGPLGPTWQPVYDLTYSIMMQTVNLPHLSAITFVAITIATITGHLRLNPIMPFVSLFLMARVPFVGCCMSLCLHRYFAHGAFKTSRAFQMVIAFVGSMALQGGVAWLGWVYYETHHDWAFLPKRLLTPEMLFMNLFFFFPNIIVTLMLVPVFGKEWALFLCWVPGLCGGLATTHFNVDYHPPIADRKPGQCIGVNKKSGDKGIGPLRLDWLAKNAPWMFEPLVGEAFHDDHHNFPRRAHRPGFDVPYDVVLRPLAKLGIIWDLQQPLPTDDFVTFNSKSTAKTE
mmetsp:Transcript_22858/g.32722  ORF Transcript_22858/g.32722 Transcript_22858/m.32722 type:complete len:317 (-) Transcript_22858:894-1844(-)|eukprot:CAMPEP_0202444550 /NCGR_PEP_ID=MMETSP1360-20130828/3584_1 /ASSEMBLY_ACC=CAM_ASM_000848 /TAXON_ID=515479 /ORGANISM="Licmophora paradoxa, Strain CCMP2313" /LENGTH=316 /DNA_ID=CAMNT_0049060569 /DNA_START=77 /DNA_END=1027 /DNA_ORIENTATION=-